MKRNFLTKPISLLLNLLVLASFVNCQNQAISLNSNWTILNQNKRIVLNNVQLPATIHSVLINKKLISNPLTSLNTSENFKWIDDDEWIFEKFFFINDSTSLKSFFYELEFDSIDTIAKVYLNDYFVLFAQNQFIKYSVRNLNSKLKEGSNRLLIEFKSPLKHSHDLFSLYPYNVPQKCANKRTDFECHLNFIRKQQFSLGSVSFNLIGFLFFST
jgi:beta-mannosidase